MVGLGEFYKLQVLLSVMRVVVWYYLDYREGFANDGMMVKAVRATMLVLNVAVSLARAWRMLWLVLICLFPSYRRSRIGLRVWTRLRKWSSRILRSLCWQKDRAIPAHRRPLAQTIPRSVFHPKNLSNHFLSTTSHPRPYTKHLSTNHPHHLPTKTKTTATRWTGHPTNHPSIHSHFHHHASTHPHQHQQIPHLSTAVSLRNP